MQILTCDSKQQLGEDAAALGADLIRAAIRDRGRANIILATGGSQVEVVDNLTHAEDIYWPSVTVFHLDEYVGMPITHPASFRRFLWERFVRLLPLPLAGCHYINAEKNPQAECERVSQIIARHPIDVAFVGIGENGHMAFNDPPADFEIEDPYLIVDLDERCRRQQVGEGWFPGLADVPKKAISMSVHQILLSRDIIVSVPDLRKSQAVKDSVERPVDPLYPLTCLQKHSRTHLYLDRDSASMLEGAVAK